MSETERTYFLKVRGNASGYYAGSRDKVMDNHPFATHEDAEDVRRAMMNGAEFEVVEAA